MYHPSILRRKTGILTGLVESKIRLRKSFKSLTSEDILKNYELEEENFLKSIEKKKRASRPVSREIPIGEEIQEINGNELPAIENVSSSCSVDLPDSTTANSAEYFDSFCHMMRYVAKLKRQNDQLKRQVLCLDEMRQIDELQKNLTVINDSENVTR